MPSTQMDGLMDRTGYNMCYTESKQEMNKTESLVTRHKESQKCVDILTNMMWNLEQGWLMP